MKVSKYFLATLFFTFLALHFAFNQKIIRSAFACDYSVSTNSQLQNTNSSVRPGQVVCLGNGTYTIAPIPSSSGSSSGGYITYRAVSSRQATILKVLDFSGKSYLKYENLRLIIDGSHSTKWFDSNSSSHHIQIIGNEFDTTGSANYNPALIEGQNFTFRDNIIKNTGGLVNPGDHQGIEMGNIFQIRGSSANNILFEHNDFSQSKCAHTPFKVCGGTNIIIRGNYFRNPWDRIFELTGNYCISPKDMAPTENILMEDNLFFDAFLGGNNTCESCLNSNSNKFDALKAIVRDNLFLHNNQGSGSVGAAVFTFSYRDSGVPINPQYGYNRFYHNTFYQNKNNSISHNPEQNGDTVSPQELIIFKNNVFSEQEEYIVWIPLNDWDQFIFENNLMANSVNHGSTNISLRTGEFSVSSAQSRYPSQYFDNLASSPRFLNQSYYQGPDSNPKGYSIQHLDDFFQAYFLSSSSPGKNYAKPLTQVSSSSSSTTIRVRDNNYFFDGLGMESGDEIIVLKSGGQQIKTRVVSKSGNDTLRVSQVVSVSSGDKIYLARTGVSPDIGIYGGKDSQSTPTPTPPSSCPHRSSGDVSCDGVVNISDLVLVGANFGTTDAQADANGDGIVNIVDLVLVGANFGEVF